MLNILALPRTGGHRLGGMSAHGGMPARRGSVLLVAAALAVALAGCEYSGPEESPAQPTSAATPEPRSFEENVDDVVRMLGAPASDPGMPSEAEPVGKLSIVLAPGDYLVTGACAGVYGAKLTMVKADGVPEAASFECDSTLERFVRHAGGPITISAVPPTGRPSATGVKVQPNTDPRASELADFGEWSSKQLLPHLPGEVSGSGSTNTTTTGTLMAEPGRYDLRFVCEGPSKAELSVSTAAGAEALAPVQVPCNGRVFRARVLLRTDGSRPENEPGRQPGRPLRLQADPHRARVLGFTVPALHILSSGGNETDSRVGRADLHQRAARRADRRYPHSARLTHPRPAPHRGIPPRVLSGGVTPVRNGQNNFPWHVTVGAGPETIQVSCRSGF